jgi:transcription antitermination factor NusG
VEQVEGQTPGIKVNYRAALPWYALQVRTRYEKQVAAALLVKGYEGFLPMFRKKSRWSDRIKEVELPLFPGYLFCRFDINKRLPILITNGVMRVVGAGKTLHPIDECEISAILTVVASGLQAEPFPYLEIGQRVRIEHGSLSGVEGILIGAKRPAKLILSVTLLQRSVAVEIDERWVIPAEKIRPLVH